MRRLSSRSLRFAWRAARNLASLTAPGRRLLFSPGRLAAAGGRGDAEYAWAVFGPACARLGEQGFTGTRRALEVGPGRNLGTGLLWWAWLEAVARAPSRVVLWDVLPLAAPTPAGWSGLAAALLAAAPPGGLLPAARRRLEGVAAGGVEPEVRYVVCPPRELPLREGEPFGLVYSQAVLEHVWEIAATLRTLRALTAPGGWHYHHVDLADHGRRETNFLEMCEWSDAAYWLTARFVPGAINRWRAGDYERFLRELAFTLPASLRSRADALPVPRARLARRFRHLADDELLTRQVSLVAHLPFAATPA